jgi:hypothetical protein
MSVAEDLKLLTQLGSVEDIQCIPLTDADHVAGGIPRWAELRLDIQRDGKLLQHYLTRHDGEAINLSIIMAMHPNAGRPVSGVLWAQLDEAMEHIMSGELDEEVEKPRMQGKALGLAYAIAAIRSPHDPDVDAVRREAKERYEAR